jgi:hypothetical protein
MSNRSPDVSPLVDRAIVASISEPWNFQSFTGDNLLTGRIAATSDDGEPVEWLLCQVARFAVGGKTISTVAAVRRYAGEEPVQQLLAHGTTTAQLLYDQSGAALTPERVRAILAAPRTSPPAGIAFLVGSLRT